MIQFFSLYLLIYQFIELNQMDGHVARREYSKKKKKKKKEAHNNNKTTDYLKIENFMKKSVIGQYEEYDIILYNIIRDYIYICVCVCVCVCVSKIKIKKFHSMNSYAISQVDSFISSFMP